MKLDLTRFFKACNPSKTLDLSNPEDRKYYIDFSSVRGGQIIAEMERTIVKLLPNEPTCQLFTGHIGCGKSTELLRLKYQLEQQGFHVVYFESSEDLVMADVDITDILLAITHQVSKSVKQAKIKLFPKNLNNFIQQAIIFLRKTDFLGEYSINEFGKPEFNDEEASFDIRINKITAASRNSSNLRKLLRQYLEPRTETLLEQINQELLLPATEELKRRGKKGLVVIVDNLDRVDNKLKVDRTQPQYLFVERGEQLKQLACHVVYSIPLVLTFSNDLNRLNNRFGVEPKILPMVQVKLRDGKECQKGMTLLRNMVLAKAFPDVEVERRLSLVSIIFENLDQLDRLCYISGGHVRNLLVILYSCLQKQDPPISSSCLEKVIQIQHDTLIRSITDDEKELLQKIKKNQQVRGEEEYKILLRSLLVFEYQDNQGVWFDINPIYLNFKQSKRTGNNILTTPTFRHFD